MGIPKGLNVNLVHIDFNKTFVLKTNIQIFCLLCMYITMYIVHIIKYEFLTVSESHYPNCHPWIATMLLSFLFFPLPLIKKKQVIKRERTVHFRTACYSSW